MSATAEILQDPCSPKRRAVLDAAAHLFIAQGYGAVSMEAIARAAGVSKATLYAHFGSKDQLFATIIGDACRLKQEWQELLSPQSVDIRATLSRMGRRVLGFLVGPEAIAIYRVVIAEGARFPELGRAFYEGGTGTFRRMFAGWLMEQTAAGRLEVTDPLMAADQLIALIKSGVYVRAMLGVPPPPTQAEIEATADAAADTFMKAFGPRDNPKDDPPASD